MYLCIHMLSLESLYTATRPVGFTGSIDGSSSSRSGQGGQMKGQLRADFNSICGLKPMPKAPSRYAAPTLGPKVCNSGLVWTGLAPQVTSVNQRLAAEQRPIGSEFRASSGSESTHWALRVL